MRQIISMKELANQQLIGFNHMTTIVEQAVIKTLDSKGRYLSASQQTSPDETCKQPQITQDVVRLFAYIRALD